MAANQVFVVVGKDSGVATKISDSAKWVCFLKNVLVFLAYFIRIAKRNNYVEEFLEHIFKKMYEKYSKIDILFRFVQQISPKKKSDSTIVTIIGSKNQ
jgi:hypothetical protein